MEAMKVCCRLAVMLGNIFIVIVGFFFFLH